MRGETGTESQFRANLKSSTDVSSIILRRSLQNTHCYTTSCNQDRHAFKGQERKRVCDYRTIDRINEEQKSLINHSCTYETVTECFSCSLIYLFFLIQNHGHLRSPKHLFDILHRLCSLTACFLFTAITMQIGGNFIKCATVSEFPVNVFVLFV